MLGPKAWLTLAPTTGRTSSPPAATADHAVLVAGRPAAALATRVVSEPSTSANVLAAGATWLDEAGVPDHRPAGEMPRQSGSTARRRASSAARRAAISVIPFIDHDPTGAPAMKLIGRRPRSLPRHVEWRQPR